MPKKERSMTKFQTRIIFLVLGVSFSPKVWTRRGGLGYKLCRTVACDVNSIKSDYDFYATKVYHSDKKKRPVSATTDTTEAQNKGMTRNTQDQPLEGGTCSSNNLMAIDNHIQSSAGIDPENNLDAKDQTSNSTDGEQNLKSSDGNEETSMGDEFNDENNKCEKNEFNDVDSKNGNKSMKDDDQCRHQLPSFEQDVGYTGSYDPFDGTSDAVNRLNSSSINVDQVNLLNNGEGDLQIDKLSSPLNKEILNCSPPFSLWPDKDWSQNDSELLDNIFFRYEQHKWKYIQAAFYNYTGRMIDAEIIKSYYNDMSN